MPRKTHGSGSRLPGIPSTNAMKRKVFGVTQQELEEILATVRRLMKDFLDIKLLASHQDGQLAEVESAVKEEFPDVFGRDEHRMQYLWHYIYVNHSLARTAYYKKLGRGGEMGETAKNSKKRRTEVCGFVDGGSDAMILGESGEPFGAGALLGNQRENPSTEFEPQPQIASSQSVGPQASLPPDSVGPTTTQPRARRGRPPAGSGRTPAGNGASPAPASAAIFTQPINPQIECVVQLGQDEPSTAHVPALQDPLVEVPTPPNPQTEISPTGGQDADSGLKEVEQFLRACKPCLVHLLDHLAYYGCVNGEFLEYLAGRAERLEEEEFHRYLRNHFSKGYEGNGQEGTSGRRDLTELEVLVLTEGLLSLKSG